MLPSTLATAGFATQINVWILDSGATDHMICSLSLFTTPPQCIDLTIYLPTGTTTKATHRGHVTLHNGLTLHDALLVPTFSLNLISV